MKVLRADGVSVGVSRIAVRDAAGRIEEDRTDESGRCSFAAKDFQEGALLDVFAACLKPDRLYWAIERVLVPSKGGKEFDVPISYSTGVRINGTLGTSEGTPIRNSEVWISVLPRWPTGSPDLVLFQKLIAGGPQIRVPTDDSGMFHVDHLPLDFRFAFRSDAIRRGGGIPLEVDSTLVHDFSEWFYSANSGVFKVRLTAVAPPRVRIVIKDSAGQILPGASVGFIVELANDQGLTPSSRGVRETSADGSVEFEVPLIAGQTYASLSGRRFWVVVRHEKWGICYDSGSVVLPQSSQEVRFGQGGGPHWLRVKFVDATSGAAIVGMKTKLASLASAGALASATSDENGMVEFKGIGEPDNRWTSSGAYPDLFEVRVTQDSAQLAKVLGEAVERGADSEEIARICKSEFPVELDRECVIRIRSRN